MDVPMYRPEPENPMSMLLALQQITDSNNDSRMTESEYALRDNPTIFSNTDDAGQDLRSNEFSSTLDSDIRGGNCLLFDYHDTSDSALSFEPMSATTEEVSLQVDHNGTRVFDSSTTSAWVQKSDFPDTSPAFPACSPNARYSHHPTSKAGVFAAAMTAAMIVDRPDTTQKRPRAPALEYTDENYLGDDDTDSQCNDDIDDDTTQTSLEQFDERLAIGRTENGGSPRSVMSLANSGRRGNALSSEQRLTQANGYFSAPPGRQLLPELSGIRDFATRETSSISNDKGKIQDQMSEASIVKNLVENAVRSKKRRAEAMERFRRKKAVRCYGRRVRYQVRKRIATTRPRVNGRFARRADAGAKTTPVMSHLNDE